MDSIGSRLKEERERLCMTIPEFADAAGAKKNTVIGWQNDTSSPPAAKLAVLGQQGVDVTYVLTGVRMPPDLQDYIRRMLKVTAENDPDGTGSLTALAGQAIKQIGPEQARRQALQQLIARCSTDDLDMIEPLIKRLIQ